MINVENYPRLMDQAKSVVNKAIEQSNLAESPVCGFDGGYLKWAWHYYFDSNMTDRRVAQAAVMVRPDAFVEGAEIVVSGSAWMVENRHAAWSRTYKEEYLPLDAAVDQQSSISSTIGKALTKAAGEARSNVDRLGLLAAQHQDLVAQLRSKNLLRE